MKIRVLRKHIKRGIPQEAEYCPIALAIKEKTHKKVWVTQEVVRVGKTIYTTPNKAWNFMTDFDYDMTVRPFTFNMELE